MAPKPSTSTCHCESHGQLAPKGSPVIALVGAPNAGKSTLFNGLTGAKARMGNWPGTTVEVSRGAWHIGETTYDVIDFPGAYKTPMPPSLAIATAMRDSVTVSMAAERMGMFN